MSPMAMTRDPGLYRRGPKEAFQVVLEAPELLRPFCVWPNLWAGWQVEHARVPLGRCGILDGEPQAPP